MERVEIPIQVCLVLCVSISLCALLIYIRFSLFQVILLLGNGPDAAPRKVFLMYKKEEDGRSSKGRGLSEQKNFSWRPVGLFFVWVFIWTSYVFILCGIFMRNYGGLPEMFNRY